MTMLKTKIGLSILLFMAAIIGLSAWGLMMDSSDKKLTASRVSLLEKQLSSSSQSSSLTSQSPVQPSTAQPSASPAAPQSTGASSAKNSVSSSPVSNVQLSQSQLDGIKSRTYAVRGYLEVFQTDNGYYPSDINSSTFAPLVADGSISSIDNLNLPSGAIWVYQPSPSGCTTAAHNCQHYVLDSVKSSDNSVIQELKSFE